MNTCPIDQLVALYHIFDQLYNNERNATGEGCGKRMEGVLWASVHQRAGYSRADGFKIKTPHRVLEEPRALGRNE